MQVLSGSKDGNAYRAPRQGVGAAVHLMDKGRKKARAIHGARTTRNTPRAGQYRSGFAAYKS
jgi:hypothetical protein